MGKFRQMTLELWPLIEVKKCILFSFPLSNLVIYRFFLKCLLVYISFNLKCLLVYIFQGTVKIYKIKSGFGQRGGTYVFL